MDKRIHSIDFAKGICMIVIMLNHCVWLEGESNRYLFPFWLNMTVPVLMVISGYVYTKSYEKHGVNNLEMAYEPRNFIDKIIRYTIPYTIAIALEYLINWCFGTRWTAGVTLIEFLVGGKDQAVITTQ